MLITLKGSPVRPSVSAIPCPQVTHTDACKLFGQEMDGEIMSNDRAPVAQKQNKTPRILWNSSLCSNGTFIPGHVITMFVEKNKTNLLLLWCLLLFSDLLIAQSSRVVRSATMVVDAMYN